MNFQFKTFNQFFKFGIPIHNKQNLNLNLEEGQLERGTTWIFNSLEHSINFQNLELLSTKNKIWIWTWNSNFQFMKFSINQFSKFGTPIHKNQNLNLSLNLNFNSSGIPIRKWRARFLRGFKVFYITESQPQYLINFQNLVRLG